MAGDYDKAISDLDIAIRNDPNMAIAFGARGAAYGAKGDFTRALNDLNEAIRINVNYAWAYNERARVYRAQGRNDLADADTATYNRLTR